MVRAILVAFLCLGVAYPARAREPMEHIVQVISDYDNLRMYFKPKTIIIEPGDRVTWVNQENEDHNVVSYPDGYPKGAEPLLSTHMRHKNQRWSHTFRVGGTYEYHCVPHLPMGMHGTVIVSRPSTESEFHVPSRQEMKRYSDRLAEFFDEDEFKFVPRRLRHRAERLQSPQQRHRVR